MTLFVSGLGRNITEQELRKMFLEFGMVTKINFAIDARTRTSKGFAFVDMPIEEEATKAIEKLNKSVVKGKSVSVQEARPKEDKPGKEGPGIRRSSRD